MKNDTQQQTKHTPGPWHTEGLAVYAAYSHNTTFYGRLRDFSNPVAQVCGDPMAEGAEIEQCRRDDGTAGPSWRSPGASEAEANARLIAAAPDLLAFAKWAKETLIGESGAAWSHWEQFPEFRAGMKAIEKAEGRP